MDKNPECDEVKELVKKWRAHLAENFYECPDEILAGLGQMYVQDERLKKNLDKCQEGLAEFISAAIKCYCENK